MDKTVPVDETFTSSLIKSISIPIMKKIKNLPAQRMLTERIRISNGEKFGLILNSLFQYKMNLV